MCAERSDRQAGYHRLGDTIVHSMPSRSRDIGNIEADRDVRVVVFDSAVDGFFLNHSDFGARIEDLTSMPAGPTGLPPWSDYSVKSRIE